MPITLGSEAECSRAEVVGPRSELHLAQSYSKAKSVRDGIARVFVCFFGIQVVAFSPVLCRHGLLFVRDLGVSVLPDIIVRTLQLVFVGAVLHPILYSQPFGIEFAVIEEEWK